MVPGYTLFKVDPKSIIDPVLLSRIPTDAPLDLVEEVYAVTFELLKGSANVESTPLLESRPIASPDPPDVYIQ
jgi:hypothetical protein